MNISIIDPEKNPDKKLETSTESGELMVETEIDDLPPKKPRHGDKTAARAEKEKRLQAALRNNLRRRKSQSRARKD